jgi:hypothetical protein
VQAFFCLTRKLVAKNIFRNLYFEIGLLPSFFRHAHLAGEARPVPGRGSRYAETWSVVSRRKFCCDAKNALTM